MSKPDESKSPAPRPLTLELIADMVSRFQRKRANNENLTEFMTGPGFFIPAVAAGVLLPEVLATFAGNDALVGALSHCPHDVQRRLLRGELLPLVVKTGDSFTTVSVHAGALSEQQVDQVFREPPVTKDIEVNPVAGWLRAGNYFVPLSEVEESLREAGFDI